MADRFTGSDGGFVATISGRTDAPRYGRRDRGRPIIVFLTQTRIGFDGIEAVIKDSGTAVWIGAGVPNEQEQATLRREGVDLTVFNFELLSADQDAINNGLFTIAEHHPEEPIWMEQIVVLP